MQKLFYHSYKYNTDRHVFPYTMEGPEIEQAITLHPVKSPATMYEVTEHFVCSKTSVVG